MWMLTGDKGETAHQIAFSCGLYPNQDESFKAYRFEEVPYGKMVTEKTILEEEAKVIDEMLHLDSATKFGFTISGTSLVSMLNDNVQTERLLRVFDRSQSVVVYRCSPNQKA